MTRFPIYKIPVDPDGDLLGRYGHPNGWRIVHCRRSWDERVGMMRGASLAGPKQWWEVWRAYDRDHVAVHSDSTLRDCRVWCDEHQIDPATRRVVLYSE